VLWGRERDGEIIVILCGVMRKYKSGIGQRPEGSEGRSQRLKEYSKIRKQQVKGPEVGAHSVHLRISRKIRTDGQSEQGRGVKRFRNGG
jgi:hypothetical protein